MVNVRLRKSGLPMIAATMGITRLLTSELTTAANARPMTNATASSTMLPLKRKSLNSLIMVPPSIADLGHLHRTTPVTLRCSELPGSDLASHEMEADTCYRRHPEWRTSEPGQATFTDSVCRPYSGRCRRCIAGLRGEQS